jgi:gliding motility-associated-like protein
MNVYELQVVDQCGYMSADTVIVDVLADCMVIIPNIFTPNGDGDNDEFIIADEHGGIKTFSMAIFNRWGKKVFETSDIRNGWNGDNSPDGTYFYIITAETSNGQPFNKQGYFQLLGK